MLIYFVILPLQVPTDKEILAVFDHKGMLSIEPLCSSSGFIFLFYYFISYNAAIMKGSLLPPTWWAPIEAPIPKIFKRT